MRQAITAAQRVRTAGGLRTARQPRTALVAAAIAAVALAGCASEEPTSVGTTDDTSASPASTPSATETSASGPIDPEQRCAARMAGFEDVAAELEAVTIDSPSGAQLYAVTAGSGPRGVLIVGSGFFELGVCYWLPTFGWLPDQGFQVLTYDARCAYESTCSEEPRHLDDIAAGVAELRDRGATEVVLVGASSSGAYALLAAARPAPGFNALVSLSSYEVQVEADTEDSEYATAVDAVPNISVPVLYAITEGDPALSVSATRQLYEATPTEGSSVQVLPDHSGHAQSMLFTGIDATEPSAFAQTFVDFLTLHAGG